MVAMLPPQSRRKTIQRKRWPHLCDGMADSFGRMPSHELVAGSCEGWTGKSGGFGALRRGRGGAGDEALGGGGEVVHLCGVGGVFACGPRLRGHLVSPAPGGRDPCVRRLSPPRASRPDFFPDPG